MINVGLRLYRQYNKYEDRGLFERLTCLGKEYPGANLVARKLRNLPQALRLLWTNEKLLNVVEQIVGPDIQGHPVWALRTKTPQNEATTVPWHQDSAFLDNDSYKVLQLTAWIPFLDATEENGCMQVVRRAHRKGKVATHQCCAGNTWYVILEEEEIERTLGANMKKDVVTCPVPYGGMLLFSNLLPHQSLLNQSDKIRWSVDFRWQTSKEKVGFWGLKPGVQMRMSNKPDFTIDWSEFDAINRYNVMAQHENENYLETVVTGPWMKKWELIHHNHHVNALLKQNEQDSYDNIVNP
ncbi:DgyrCDS3464 [Dimorphilus gyrociliatus]|uniref:DgyrCDS3464 n=1 Tax=Dimorphilus gyrociliatus TaxID=2664684 RepID=A0A7I8VGD2_9ANNE|nr:DgyrCDS3464 [Dimorphilus gyrociliatus]